MSEDTHDIFALPPRRETFLAHYPRNLKLSFTAAIFALMVLPPAWMYGQLHRHASVAYPPLLLKEAELGSLPVSGAKAGTNVNAPALNDQDDRSVKLLPAPDSRVTEDTFEGSLPRISEDGARPWQVYARPFNGADKRPRIAIVITGLGLSRIITDQAITLLPPTVTLSFSSQGAVIGAWGTRARQDGHEILLQIPLEPFDYPRNDTGPDTLLTNLPNSENLARLSRVLRRATGYVGLTAPLSSTLVTDQTKFEPVLQAAKDRGLMLLDSRATTHSIVTDMARRSGVPVATVTQRLDTDLAPDAIAATLEDLEKTARQTGRAVGITEATPVMITQLQTWLKTLPEHGIALAPLSATVN